MTPVRWWRQAFRIVRIAVNTREHSLGIIKFGDVTSAGVPGDSWYVEALGVRPDLQRAGRGKRLMATVFGLIDDAGGPSYLETTKPDNVGYYTALGYDAGEVARAARAPRRRALDLPDASRPRQRDRLASAPQGAMRSSRH